MAWVVARVITWLRLRSSAALPGQLLWAGINSAMVEQRARAFNEVLPSGSGEPDQQVTLSRTPVLHAGVLEGRRTLDVQWGNG